MKTLVLALSVGFALSGCGGGGSGGGSAGFPVAMASAPAAVEAPAAPAKAPADCSIELYGDSISIGNGVLDVPVAARIRSLRGWPVTDHSAKGMSAAVASQSFPNANRTGRVVVLALGTNDITLGTSPADPLRAMANYAKAEGRKVIFTGIPAVDTTRTAEFNADERAVADQVGAAWAGWETVSHDTLDGVHPTQAMSDALTDRLVSAVEATLPECRP